MWFRISATDWSAGRQTRRRLGRGGACVREPASICLSQGPYVPTSSRSTAGFPTPSSDPVRNEARVRPCASEHPTADQSTIQPPPADLVALPGRIWSIRLHDAGVACHGAYRLSPPYLPGRTDLRNSVRDRQFRDLKLRLSRKPGRAESRAKKPLAADSPWSLAHPSLSQQAGEVEEESGVKRMKAIIVVGGIGGLTTRDVRARGIAANFRAVRNSASLASASHAAARDQRIDRSRLIGPLDAAGRSHRSIVLAQTVTVMKSARAARPRCRHDCRISPFTAPPAKRDPSRRRGTDRMRRSTGAFGSSRSTRRRGRALFLSHRPLSTRARDILIAPTASFRVREMWFRRGSAVLERFDAVRGALTGGVA